MARVDARSIYDKVHYEHTPVLIFFVPPQRFGYAEPVGTVTTVNGVHSLALSIATLASQHAYYINTEYDDKEAALRDWVPFDGVMVDAESYGHYRQPTGNTLVSLFKWHATLADAKVGNKTGYVYSIEDKDWV